MSNTELLSLLALGLTFTGIIGALFRWAISGVSQDLKSMKIELESHLRNMPIDYVRRSEFVDYREWMNDEIKRRVNSRPVICRGGSIDDDHEGLK